MHLMRGWLLCPSFFFSFLFNAKLLFSTFGLRRAPFNSIPQLSEVRWASSVPWPIVFVQPLHESRKYFPRTPCQYSPRFTSSEMPSPLLSTVSSLHPPTYIFWQFDSSNEGVVFKLRISLKDQEMSTNWITRLLTCICIMVIESKFVLYN